MSIPSVDKENIDSNRLSSIDGDHHLRPAETQSTNELRPLSVPSISSFDSLEVIVQEETTPIEKLKTIFFKHVALKKPNNNKIIIKKHAEKEVGTVEDEVSQHGLPPGTIQKKACVCGVV